MAVALTEQQASIVAASGDFLLLACPGSGKTRTSAARIARLIDEGRRVAACSFTNVGADRIGAMLARDHRRHFEPRNFNGTLHGFLLRYVVYPFADLLGAEKAPQLWFGEWPSFAYEGNHALRLSFDQFRRDPQGALVFSAPPSWAYRKADEVLARVESRVLQGKRDIFKRRGVLSSDDAMWAALQILRERPVIAGALAGRFDEILVDEAQDTSDLQLACLEQIKASDHLTSLVMVGDLEQSIYSYQGASADACRKLAKDTGLRTVHLSENHRSSQKICDVSGRFCNRGPDRAVGPNRDCPIDPEVFLYPPDQPAEALTHYRERLSVHGIDAANACVLARSHTMVQRIAGREEPSEPGPMARTFGALSASLAAGTLDRWDISRAEAAIAHGAFDAHPTELDPAVREQLRGVANFLIGNLPPLSGNLQDWILAARSSYDLALARLTDEPRHKPGLLLKAPARFSGFQAADIFAPRPTDLTPRTVHSLKGEEREAVLVVVKKHHGSDRAKQMQFLETSLEGGEIGPDEEEEQRINYVALSRAERFCLIAFPDDPRGRKVAAKCIEIGFRSKAQ